jgi:hypothetical protein
LICRDILPSLEKKLNRPRGCLVWRCLDEELDRETWLRFYASDEERTQWAEETGEELPPSETAPYPRQMPRH